MLKKKFGNLFKILAEFFNFFIVALLYMEGTCKRNIFRSIQHIPLTTRPVCPGDASPSKGEGGLLGLGVKIPLTDIEILREGNAEDSWWPGQGRKANVDLRWNKLEMPNLT